MSVFDQLNRFMESYPRERPKGVSAAVIIFLILFVVIGGVLSNYRSDTEIFFAAFIYMILMLVSAMVGVIELARVKPFQAYIFFPRDFRDGLIKLGIGAAIGWFLVSQAFTIGVPLQLTGLNSFLFIVVAAPIVEEAFFRATLIPSIAGALKVGGITRKWNWVAAIVFGNAMFAYWHGYVYGFSPQAMMGAFYIGIFYTILMVFFKDSNANIGAHMANNYLLWAAAGGVLLG